MCGLFGALHCGDVDSASLVALAVTQLGLLSEERGRDSSGVAIVTPNASTKKAVKRTDASRSLYTDETTTLVKDTVPFSDLVQTLKPHLGAVGSLYIGHTRWATQGDAAALNNASPMHAGMLVGTHNGDVEVSSVPDHQNHRKGTFGGTDTEILYRALNRARGDRRKMTKVLRNVKGRAALAFVSRTDTSRLFLARAALSPLSYAYDTDGNFYWASNPNWFRIVSEKTGIEFAEITLVPEGHLLTIDTTTGEVEDVRRFTPSCRESDLRLVNTAVYRNFNSQDKAADIKLQRHHVITALPEWKTFQQVPLTRPAAAVEAKPAAAKQAPLFTSPAVTSTSSLDARLAWEEDDVWGSTDDPWATDSSDIPPKDFFDTLEDSAIDLDEVEELCYHRGEFDMHSYMSILEADDEDVAAALVQRLRERKAAA